MHILTLTHWNFYSASFNLYQSMHTAGWTCSLARRKVAVAFRRHHSGTSNSSKVPPLLRAALLLDTPRSNSKVIDKRE